ncbi:MAG: TIGR03279 family radical SAM protein [Cyanobacteria bacterium P01_E01_bin.6]
MSRATITPALITKVLPGSIAEDIGFEPGDRLVAINGEYPRDLIDYRFLCADEELALDVLDASGKRHSVDIEKDYDDDLGLEFETALFDGLIQCNNQCPFCFIDQQPPGKRETLYLKDDDYRLSFLYGSYLTLTNLTQPEWERIAQLRLSPLYVSVHATEPDIRIRLLKNSRAGQILDHIQWFQDQHLQLHAQVVVCPGINDGVHLQQTLLDLARFRQGDYPAVASVAVVPVGLTRFRPAEDELVPVTQDMARDVIQRVQALQRQFQEKFGSAFAWLADEWFLIGCVDLPPEAHYEDYPQIGNGVGSIHLFLKEFAQAALCLPDAIPTPRRLTWVVGNAVENAFHPILQRLNNVNGLTVQMVALNSIYWGQDISVTGLLTGQDLLHTLKGYDVGEGILLPSLMLKHDEACFLDDMTVNDLAQELDTTIWPIHSASELIQQAVSSTSSTLSS